MSLSKPTTAEVKHAALEAFAVSYISNSFYFFLPHPVCVLLSQLEFNVLCSFLYFSFWVCFDFFMLKSLLTKGASPFNSCWETSAQWIQTAWQCGRPDQTCFGQASTSCPWLCVLLPLQLGCISWTFIRAHHGLCWFLEWELSALDVKASCMFSHLKSLQGEIWDLSFCAHTLNFLWLAS